MGRIDVVAQPDPWVGDPHHRVAQPLGDLLRRLARRPGGVLEAEGLPAQGGAFDQRLGQPVVVIARHKQHLAAAHCLTDLLEEGPHRGEHAGEGQFAELQSVAQQNKPVRAGDLLRQHRADRGVAEQVLAEGAAQMQVGDDGRSQGHNLFAL
jgi:hypothetical protein